MDRKILILTFMDEGGKHSRMQIANPKEGLDGNTCKAAAEEIVRAGIFRTKGKYVAAVKAEIVVTTADTLFANHE